MKSVSQRVSKPMLGSALVPESKTIAVGSAVAADEIGDTHKPKLMSPFKQKNGKSEAQMKSVTSQAKKTAGRGNSPVRNKGHQPGVKYDTNLSKATALIEDKRKSAFETRDSQTVLGGSLIFRDPIEIPLQIR